MPKRFQPSRGRNKAVRRSGGGRKNYLEPLLTGVKLWFECEREHGRFVDRGDLFAEMHARVELTVEHFQLKSEGVEQLPKHERETHNACKLFLRGTDKTHERCLKNVEFRKDQIVRFCKARLLKPQRLTALTLEQEAWRCEQTWKMIDHRMWLSAFGSAEDLKPYLAQPEVFMSQREHLVIVQSDQVPFYCKVASDKQMYTNQEFRPPSSKSVLTTEQKLAGDFGGHG